MDLVGMQRLTCSLPAAPRLYSHTTRPLTVRQHLFIWRAGLYLSITKTRPDPVT